LKDVVNLRKQGIKEIDSVIVSEVPSVLETTTVEDMLTLLPKIKQAIPVVSEDNVLLGVVSPSSIIIEMTGKDQNEIDKIIQNAIDL
jgi:glycine betaine/proline transport system ATP-binding protein